MSNLKQYYSSKTFLSAQIIAILAMFSLPISTTATAILFPLSLVLLLASGNWRENWLLLWDQSITKTFVVLAALFVVGLIYTIAPWHLALKQIVKHYWLFTAPVFLPLFTEKQWRRYAVNALILAMVITLVLAYAKFFGVIAIARNGSTAIFKDHIVQNTFMAFCATIVMYRFFFEKKHRAFYLILALIMSFEILFMSDGRTGYFLYGFFLLYLFYFRFGFKGLFFSSLIAIGLFTAAFFLSSHFHQNISYAIVHTLHYNQAHSNTSMGIRIKLIENAWYLFQQHPWFGFGTGSIHTAYATLPVARINWIASGFIISDFSNIYLNIMVQFGAVGLAIFLGVMVWQWRLTFTLPNAERFLAQLLLLMIWLGGLANSWLTDTTHAHLYAIWLMMSFAALVAKPGLVRYQSCNDDVVTGTPV